LHEIVFDTETTGLDFREDRVIELGAVELLNRFPTGRTFHVLINPQGRAVHHEALAIHGIGEAQLAGKPTFKEIIEEFLEFIGDAKLIAHNANFDLTFLNAEFDRLGKSALNPERIIDTLVLARRKHPMGPNSLDALCRRYGIDNSHRTKHGALLDSELLAEVYIELAGGKQAALILDTPVVVTVAADAAEVVTVAMGARPHALQPRLTEAEIVAHKAMVAGLGEKALWRKLDA